MEGKNILCTNREIMHLCQVNKIGQYMYINENNGTVFLFRKGAPEIHFKMTKMLIRGLRVDPHFINLS